jgi:hypothetical protein
MPRPGSDTLIELATCAGDGWPHLAQLSAGEIDLGDDGLIRLAMWEASQSCRALASSGLAVLLFVEAGSISEVRCRVIASTKLDTEIALTGFLLAPVAVRDKNAPYAEIISGSRFRLLDPVATERKWGEAQLALRTQLPFCANPLEWVI